MCRFFLVDKPSKFPCWRVDRAFILPLLHGEDAKSHPVRACIPKFCRHLSPCLVQLLLILMILLFHISICTLTLSCKCAPPQYNSSTNTPVSLLKILMVVSLCASSAVCLTMKICRKRFTEWTIQILPNILNIHYLWCYLTINDVKDILAFYL